MAGSLDSIVAEAKKAAHEAIETTIQDIISDATYAAEMEIYASPVKKYKRRYSFSDPGEYYHFADGLRGYVAPAQTPNSEGDPTPTTDKDLPLLIESGGFGARSSSVGYFRKTMDVEEAGLQPYTFYSVKYHNQKYDYMSIGPRPWWSDTIELAIKSDYLVVNCQEALAAHGIHATVV